MPMIQSAADALLPIAQFVAEKAVDALIAAGAIAVFVWVWNKYRDHQLRRELGRELRGDAIYYHQGITGDRLGITIKNPTGRPVVVREVAIVIEGSRCIINPDKDAHADQRGWVELLPFTQARWGFESCEWRVFPIGEVLNVLVTIEYKNVFGTSTLITIGLTRKDAKKISDRFQELRKHFEEKRAAKLNTSNPEERRMTTLVGPPLPAGGATTKIENSTPP